MHRVVLPVLDRVPMFELATGVEVFGLERDGDVPADWYELRLCAADPPPVRIGAHAVLDVDDDVTALDEADTVLVPPPPHGRREFPEPLLDALRRAHERGARVASVCTGAFVLAAAGLLDGRRATTHWRFADDLARRYPRVEVDPGVLYVDDGGVLTSAGTAAGLDLCLHMVRCDHGSRVANVVARRAVVPPHRDGGQAQYVAGPALPPTPVGGLAAALDWARSRLGEPLTVAVWARIAGMSPRTFARRFGEATGTTPLQWLADERVRWARELLEETELGVEAVASRCGFGTAAGLRKVFGPRVGTTPQAYRATFRLDAPAPPARTEAVTPAVTGSPSPPVPR